jgi:hypothetical protein
VARGARNQPRLAAAVAATLLVGCDSRPAEPGELEQLVSAGIWFVPWRAQVVPAPVVAQKKVAKKKRAPKKAAPEAVATTTGGPPREEPRPVLIVDVAVLELPPLTARSGVLGALREDDATAAMMGRSALGDDVVDKLAGLDDLRGEVGVTSVSYRGSSEMRASVDTEGPRYPDVYEEAPDLQPAPQRSPRVPTLSKPARKACLSQVSDVSGDHAYAMAQGLSATSVSRVTSAFLKNTLSCVPGEGGSMQAEIVVGCDGRVSHVGVLESDLSSESTSCVAQTLAYMGFPAHDMPDGFTFVLPLSYTR